MNKPEKFWDRSAQGYDREEMKDREVRNSILERTKRYLKKNDFVLDYGCATGILANEIAGDVHALTGIDISGEMVRIARDNAGTRSIRNVNYIQAAISDERLEPGTFDVLLSVYLLHLLDDLPAALGKIYELLKPGGLFISVTPCMGKRSLTGMALFLAGKTGLIPGIRLFDLAELTGAIAGAGFNIRETSCLQQRGQQYFIAAEKR